MHHQKVGRTKSILSGLWNLLQELTSLNHGFAPELLALKAGRGGGHGIVNRQSGSGLSHPVEDDSQNTRLL